MLENAQIRQQWEKVTSEVAGILHDVIESRSITIGNKTMKFQYFIRGDKPHDGYSLIFGLHGGGGCPTEVNNQQFNNHLHLYDHQLPHGAIWFVPRSCEQASDMWWKDYIEDFFTIVIRGFVFNKLVNPNKVFITGYSAGGDGVYHLGPRMADWLAGAAMMAGHPNNVELQNVRNISFSIQVGGQDGAYERNEHARNYIQKMNELQTKYGGFKTAYNCIHEDCSHWMNLKDTFMFPNFFREVRNPYPDCILFKQHPRTKKQYFYYIEVDPLEHKGLVTIRKNGNTFYIQSQPIKINIYVNHLMIDVRKVVEIFQNGKKTVCRMPIRRDEVIKETIEKRKDFWYIFEDFFISDPQVDLAQVQSAISANISKISPQIAEAQQKIEKQKTCCHIY